MKKPRIYRKRCNNCKAVFSGTDRADVDKRHSTHSCEAEKRHKRILDGMMRGALMGALSAFLPGLTSIPLPVTDIILGKPTTRTPNPLFKRHRRASLRKKAKGGRK
jgi:hypothetical protein